MEPDITATTATQVFANDLSKVMKHNEIVVCAVDFTQVTPKELVDWKGDRRIDYRFWCFYPKGSLAEACAVMYEPVYNQVSSPPVELQNSIATGLCHNSIIFSLILAGYEIYYLVHNESYQGDLNEAASFELVERSIADELMMYKPIRAPVLWTFNKIAKAELPPPLSRIHHFFAQRNDELRAQALDIVEGRTPAPQTNNQEEDDSWESIEVLP